MNRSRRDFLAGLAVAGAATTALGRMLPAAEPSVPEPLFRLPDWQRPRPALVLVSDQQLLDLTDPDKQVDVSVSAKPQITTLREFCTRAKAGGAERICVIFDAFWEAYRPGQKGKPRALTPDSDAYIEAMARISAFVKPLGLGLELSLLTPLEIGAAYAKATGEAGRWVHYREGWRDPKTGQYSVSLWQPLRWFNNKGMFELQRTGVRAFAFREQRIGASSFYRVRPQDIIELKQPVVVEAAEPSGAKQLLTLRGSGDSNIGPLDRVLVVAAYQTSEMDYFSQQAGPYLQRLVERYHAAGIPLAGLYSDEPHIQQGTGYASQHDEGQLALRYLTPKLSQRYAALYGPQYADLEKYLVYFAYGQHGFLSDLTARLAAQHVLGDSADDIQRTFLLRRRYYDLLHRTVVDLFVQAKKHAEKLYGHPLPATAHATWAESPTIDFWHHGDAPGVGHSRHYEYTPNFLWSNTVQQASAACDDYFRWGEFLHGGGTDHAEGGWSDRNYYGQAMACSLGIVNPNDSFAYAAGWGWPHEVGERYRALGCAFGTHASPPFVAVQGRQHRRSDVLMLYPIALVACEERFGSWMTQYGYADYLTAEKLLELGKVTGDGRIEICGRRYGTLVALFEPLPPPGLLPLLEDFVARGGKLVWSGPPPRLDMAGASVLQRWQKLCGVKQLGFNREGLIAAGQVVQFEGALKDVAPQAILTDFLVDRIYPVEPEGDAAVVARSAGQVVGLHRPTAAGGSTTFLGLRPRDDQAASLGYETRTWFDVLKTLGAYPKSRADGPDDNPAVVSRQSPYFAASFPNGTVAVAAHYRRHVESWPGGFHREPKADEAALARNPLPPFTIDLKGFCVAGRTVDYSGHRAVAFRLGADGGLAAFSGYGCDRIRIDGREYRFADRPVSWVGWAALPEAQRVPGGAVMEVWAQGQATLRIPIPTGMKVGRVFQQGGRLASPGPLIPSIVRDGWLEFATSSPAGPLYHFFVLEA